MKTVAKIFLTFALFLTFVGEVNAAPGINRVINFQGKVVNKGIGGTDGTNITDGNYNFTFSMWTTLSAGTSIWSEGWNSGTTQVAVTSGIFQAALGTYKTFPPTVDFNTNNLYVSINFNGDGEMAPRIQMAAVPYSINAEKVSGLTVTNTDGTLSIGNSKTVSFVENFVSSVGISLDQNLSTGSTVTFAGLSVGGTVAFTNIPIAVGTSVLFIDNTGKLSKGFMSVGTTYAFVNGLTDPGTHIIGLGGTLTSNTEIGVSSFSVMFSSSGNILTIGASGYLGVGTTNPLSKFHVAGNSLLSGIVGIGATGVGQTFTVIGNGYFSLGLGITGVLRVGNTAFFSAGVGITGNLSVGGSLSLTGLALGTGTSMLYIDAAGNIMSGTLPDSGSGKSRILVMSPEYSGATMSKDGSVTTTGTMTSDNSLNAGGIGWKNYYEWSSTQSSLNDYSIIARIILPSDFNTWETGSCPSSTCALEFNYQTGLNTTADNGISYVVSNDVDTPATAVCSVGSTANTSWGGSGCAEALLNDGAAPEWDAAGETAVIRIKMAAKNTASALVRAGDIILRYKSKY